MKGVRWGSRGGWGGRGGRGGSGIDSHVLIVF